MVDWSEGAAFPNYFNALVNSKKLGQMVSDFIKANKLNDVHWYTVIKSLLIIS
jgi:hypothetical protein